MKDYKPTLCVMDPVFTFLQCEYFDDILHTPTYVIIVSLQSGCFPLLKARLREYTLFAFCFSLFIGISPTYFSDLLSRRVPGRSMWSLSDNYLLCSRLVRAKSLKQCLFAFVGQQYGAYYLLNLGILTPLSDFMTTFEKLPSLGNI